jgi:hypothetical protein
LETVEFLNTGIGNLDGTTVKLLTIDIPIKSHLGILQNLIRTARGKGFASELFGEYLIVQVMDFKRIDDFDRVKRELDAKHNSIRKKWKSNNDTLVPLDSFSTLDFSRNLAPFSIFPFAPKDCADILFGRIHIRGELNLSEIMRLYVSYGWRIKDTLFDRVNRSSEALLRKGDSLFTIEKGKFTLEVPVSLVGRVAREGLHPKILIDVAESFYKAGPQAGISGFFPNFLKEGTQWR